MKSSLVKSFAKKTYLNLESLKIYSDNGKGKPSPETLKYYRCFDSQFECEVYVALRKASRRGREAIEFQPSLLIQPSNLSGVFPAGRWRCDFQWEGLYLIEAKGFLTTEWLLQMRLLHQNDLQSFNRLKIISNNTEVHEKLNGILPVYKLFEIPKIINYWEAANALID